MKIEKQTLKFLALLEQNNNREWFQENKASYEQALNNVKEFITALIAELSAFDPHINTEIQASRCLFRIYRDTRFSKDKTPYKTWFAAGISVDGRKLEGPEYYLHIAPGGSFLATGYWRPAKPHLDAIRQEIDYSYPEFVEALKLGAWTIDDLSAEDKLKRAPTGYSEDDPHIDVLKHKSFILYHSFSDVEVTSAKALQLYVDMAKRFLPFKRFIHQAIDQ